MDYEAVLTFVAPLSAVVRADLDAPLPALTRRIGPPLSPAEAAARHAEEQRRQVEEERQAVARVLASLTEAARRLQDEHRARLDEMERAAVELAVAIAGKLLHDRLANDAFPVEALVRAAVKRLPPRQPVRVWLHPRDVASLEKRLGGVPLCADNAAVDVLADPALSRGDCRVEAGEVSVVTQLRPQLAELHRLLLENVGHAEAGRAETLP